MMAFAELLLTLGVSLLINSCLVIPPACGNDWQDAHATFYGGADASGTIGWCANYCLLIMIINIKYY